MIGGGWQQSRGVRALAEKARFPERDFRLVGRSSNSLHTIDTRKNSQL